MNAPVHAKIYQLPLSSKLIKWLEYTPQQVAPYKQWRGMINNQQGIRKEEIARSGLPDMLPEDTPDEEYQLIPEFDRPTKTELIKRARMGLSRCAPTIQSHWRHAYRASLNVKTIHDSLPKHIEARAIPFVEKAQTLYQHPSLGYWIIRTGYQDLAKDSPSWIILDPQGKLVRSHERHRGWFPSAIEAFDEMHRVIKNRFATFGKERPFTLFDQYTFMGGNNYQEWFVCLPNWEPPYRDNHFELEQLLIHIRTTERVDYDGRPLLMVEEIQSPWHADIREHGSFTDETEQEEDGDLIADAPFGNEWHELALKAIVWIAVQNGHQRIGFTTGKQQCQRWGELDGLMNLYDSDIPKCLRKMASLFDCANDWATIVTNKPDGRIKYTGKDGWVVLDADGKPITAPLKNKDVALFFLSQRGAQVKEKIRLLQISPTLKHAMNTGNIPLFGW